ncbi:MULTISPECIES: nuclear transport factor 2 family protein [unclassified Paracoccus (in: a-proteobacteria)]|uniref:nuclear transport factor 2 family protein n=1 Tax=unclassified Paracoccus (in: a-proteobacteria) TaxID=2688777 RepID=UPI001604741A|nr:MULTISPECIES: nuclear transport factor 2 family protein [unclassified Paracoccus (in: a-proteobacteria)]MBB1492215.1 nuclear transport factor 2 family protein [Paracoccus sp. MC1854]MBB1498703.1 nuclear transport factor 2 family protein [Paracoccus sp. MC1862]QQO45613.1 nuclear transport factor 2 family protein [Paracoccus sp. MC1862]
MSRTDNRWADEEALWTMGAAEAWRRMHPSCVMVFPKGLMQGGEVRTWLDAGRRWTAARLTDRRMVETEDCVVLAYRVTANGKNGDTEALCSSTWVRQKDDWQMIQHQQTTITG